MKLTVPADPEPVDRSPQSSSRAVGGRSSNDPIGVKLPGERIWIKNPRNGEPMETSVTIESIIIKDNKLIPPHI